MVSKRDLFVSSILIACLVVAIWSGIQPTQPIPSETPEDAPVIELIPNKPIELHGILSSKYSQEHFYKLSPARSGWEIKLFVKIKAERNLYFGVSLLSPRWARITGVSGVAVAGEHEYNCSFVFGEVAPEFLYLRIAKDREVMEYWIRILVITHYDAGEERDAPSSYEKAIYLGELKPDRGITFRGWLGDQVDDQDVSDYYKFKVTFNGKGNITIRARPFARGLLCLSVMDEDQIRIAHSCADYFGQPVEAVVRYEGENITHYLYLIVDNIRGHDTDYEISIIQYETPLAPQPNPIPPPNWPIPSIWPFIIALILLAFWVLNIKPVGPLKDISNAADKVFKAIVKAGRKVIRDELPVGIVPRATHGLAKMWIVIFGLIASNLEAYILSCGFIPLYFLLWPPNPILILQGIGRFFTHILIHASIAHLVINLIFFIVFADNVEEKIGSWRLIAWIFLPFNLGSALAFTIAQWLIGQTMVIAVGASGVISGVMGAYYVFYPEANLVIKGKRIKAWKFLSTWFILQLLMFLSTESGIAYSAHVGGFIAGVLMARRYKSNTLS